MLTDPGGGGASRLVPEQPLFTCGRPVAKCGRRVAMWRPWWMSDKARARGHYAARVFDFDRCPGQCLQSGVSVVTGQSVKYHILTPTFQATPEVSARCPPLLLRLLPLLQPSRRVRNSCTAPRALSHVLVVHALDRSDRHDKRAGHAFHVRRQANALSTA